MIQKKLLTISAAGLFSVGSIIGGGYYLGTTAYNDGLMDGITAVVEQCAKEHSTIYNGKTGDVMVCEGGHIGVPEKDAENGLKTPSRPIQPPAGQPGIYEDPKEQSI